MTQMCCRADLDDAAAPGAVLAAGEEELRTAAGLLRALADPVRLHLFLLIAAVEEEICVCELDDVGVSQPTVSHHLRKLREAGLIDSERRGTWVYYRLTTTGAQAQHAVHVLSRTPAATSS